MPKEPCNNVTSQLSADDNRACRVFAMLHLKHVLGDIQPYVRTCSMTALPHVNFESHGLAYYERGSGGRPPHQVTSKPN